MSLISIFASPFPRHTEKYYTSCKVKKPREEKLENGEGELESGDNLLENYEHSW